MATATIITRKLPFVLFRSFKIVSGEKQSGATECRPKIEKKYKKIER